LADEKKVFEALMKRLTQSPRSFKWNVLMVALLLRHVLHDREREEAVLRKVSGLL